MPINVFTGGDLTPADILTFWKNKLTDNGIPLILQNLQDKNYLKDNENISVVIGELTPIAHYPAIRLVAGPKSSEWLALLVRKDKFQIYFDCCMRRAGQAQNVDLFINDFAGYVQNYIIALSNLQAEIDNSNLTDPITNHIFNSWSDGIEPGFSADGAMKIARISWWGETVNPYVLGAGFHTNPQINPM